jgi:L-lactate dehydrogenase complex protein LldG
VSDAKREILARIADANVAPFDAVRSAPFPSQRSRIEVVEQFAEYVAEYRANVIRCSDAQLPDTIKSALAARGSDRVVVPPDLPPEWAPNAERDADFDHRTLEQFDAVITACAIGIAETGTIVLDAGPGQGRRALSLVPDHHVCVIREDQIVNSVPEAVALLTDAAVDGRPQTWISGPSATSDIELSRVEGVHGPRALDVVIVASGRLP